MPDKKKSSKSGSSSKKTEKKSTKKAADKMPAPPSEPVISPPSAEAPGVATAEGPSLEGPKDTEFDGLFKVIDSKYHDYLKSVINNPIRRFQKSTVDDYLKLIGENGLPKAVATAIDARDYNRGNTWEQANMNIMNSLLPRQNVLNELLRDAIKEGCTEAVKWYPDASGNPREIAEVLKPVLNDKNSTNRWWAAVHLSRHAPETEGLVEALTEAVTSEWIAMRLDNSSSGMSGKGEAAKALARLGKKASGANSQLYELLDDSSLDSADAAQVAGALMPMGADLEDLMKKVSAIAERVLTERRGVGLHGGDRELLTTLRNLIGKWKETATNKTEEMTAKVELLEKEIKYHLNH